VGQRQPLSACCLDWRDVRELREPRDRLVYLPAGGRADLEVTTPADRSAARVDVDGLERLMAHLACTGVSERHLSGRAVDGGTRNEPEQEPFGHQPGMISR
jgi:hypothetical protein